jgi:hypothetical protein
MSLPASLLNEPVDRPGNATWVANKVNQRDCSQGGPQGRPLVNVRYRRPTPICELPGFQSLRQSASDYHRRQALGLHLKPTSAAVDHLMQPFLKSPTVTAHGSFLTDLRNLVKSSF